ncbi:MAG: glycosyltransferase family 2 protein [Endomicrobiaceae bacterium]|nr:glycosyltransferase family 2 protein [Endomicrobiaceae bacterium]
MDVSVIIPVYNAEPYLKQCLDSVLAQTFKNIEIIIINDCSNDNSSQIIEEYRKTDRRIISISLQKNAGPGNARNEGIKAANGKYIVFIDSDDWVTEDYVETLYNSIEKHNCDMVSANFYIYDDKTGQLKTDKNPEDLYKTCFNTSEKKQYFLFLNNNYIWIRIYRKDFLKANNIYFKLNKLEDSLFLWQAVIFSDNFMFVDKNIYYYRVNRTGSLTTTDYAESYIEGLREIKNFLINENLYAHYKQPFFLFAMSGIANSFESSKLPYKQLKDIFIKLKYEFLNDRDMKFYKGQSFLLSARMYLLYFCLKYNINYVRIIKIFKVFRFGKLLKKIYNLRMFFKIK